MLLICINLVVFFFSAKIEKVVENKKKILFFFLCTFCHHRLVISCYSRFIHALIVIIIKYDANCYGCRLT